MNCTLSCKQCGKEICLSYAIENSPYAWINLSAIWYECSNCKTGNHIKIMKDRAEIFEVLSAPGPEIEILQTAKFNGLDLRKDPKYLQVWYEKKHREIPSRK